MDLAELSPEYDYSKFEDDGTGYGCAECDDYNYYMETSEDDDERHDEKLKSEVSGTRQLIFNGGEKFDMGIAEGASAKKSSEKKMSEGDVESIAANKATIGFSKRSDEDLVVWLGTTTAAFVLPVCNCVILGSDKEKGYPSGANKRITTKTFKLADLPIGYTRAGVETDVNFLIDELKDYVRKGAIDITLIARHVYDWACTNRRNHAGQLLIGGYTRGSDVPHLYFISKDGLLDLTAEHGLAELRNRFQTGCGRGAAFIKLNNEYKRDMTESEGKKLIVDCIDNGIQNDNFTGKGIEYVVVKPGGAKISKALLADFVRFSYAAFDTPEND
ncbi:hypothetical protein MKW94_003575 [Papaver nudicaule]|uniref:Uncharacterized protein n=1 Tax=Papaver nudicaule TaxID=74823 RepID=A0AA41VXN8_PAPNU|nr:hypothetical protein [Papaver nudicaule]